MKRKILALFTFCASLIGLTACNENILQQFEKFEQLQVQSNHKHAFNREIATAEFLASEATCSSRASYYLSCSCGEKSPATFEIGNILDHSQATEWSNDKTHHWHAATCACGEKFDYDTHDFVDYECSGCAVSYFDVAFDGGTGTETDPYIVSTAEELQNIANVPTFSHYKVKDGVEELD